MLGYERDSRGLEGEGSGNGGITIKWNHLLSNLAQLQRLNVGVSRILLLRILSSYKQVLQLAAPSFTALLHVYDEL